MKYALEGKHKSVEKYVGNPFVNTKEDYYNEITQKVICSILLSKNIKKIDYLLFDLLFDFFLKRVKSIGINCKKLSALRGSSAINYIDIKFCLKIHFPPLYKEIYTSKKINILNNFTVEGKENTSGTDLINVVHNSYLYHKQLCMKKNEKNDLLNEFDSMNCFYSKNNNMLFDIFNSNKDVNVLFLNENIDVQKYKEFMKLKKKYIHDHMPIIPLTINTKEKKIGYMDSIESQEESTSTLNSDEDDEEEEHSSSSSSSNEDSANSSAGSSHFSINAESKKKANKSGTCKKENPNVSEEMSKEKIELLTLLPKVKQIYLRNSKNKETAKTFDYSSPNPFEYFDMM